MSIDCSLTAKPRFWPEKRPQVLFAQYLVSGQANSQARRYRFESSRQLYCGTGLSAQIRQYNKVAGWAADSAIEESEMYGDTRSDTPFRKFMRERVYDAAQSAIEEAAQRHLYQGVDLYSAMVEERIESACASPGSMILALCATKPEQLGALTNYYPMFYDFAKANSPDSRDVYREIPRDTTDEAITMARDYALNRGVPITVCRLFPRHDVQLEQMRQACVQHQKNRDNGVLALTVDVGTVEWDITVALARVNERECFGFLVFIAVWGQILNAGRTSRKNNRGIKCNDGTLTGHGVDLGPMSMRGGR